MSWTWPRGSTFSITPQRGHVIRKARKQNEPLKKKNITFIIDEILLSSQTFTIWNSSSVIDKTLVVAPVTKFFNPI